MITIIIADDQTLMRDGLETILSLEDDMTVVSTANNGEQVYNLVKEHRPNIVLMDIQMPIQDGIRSSEAIKRDFPETVILILTTFSDEDYIVEALVSGASGYLLKDMPGDKLIESIRDAAKGQLMMPASIAAKLANRLSFLSGTSRRFFDPSKAPSKQTEFTEREQKIIALMIKGKTNREIADTFFMSEGTIKNYISVIYGKIGVNDRTKAVMYLKKIFAE
ncbi:response regulator transcription factor [Paenibacillus mesophilus]|uniref:response regulator transcription factor n=1 Tax=Paenibacillus mesophilus TaxID=2582849 RepID=UPI00110E4EDE|nr:response regulator transcription factor [Paenibacillus mesophilus]TMV47021.1 response regulator transcription factor [Paenibacillus mesophilus]